MENNYLETDKAFKAFNLLIKTLTNKDLTESGFKKLCEIGSSTLQEIKHIKTEEELCKFIFSFNIKMLFTPPADNLCDKKETMKVINMVSSLEDKYRESYDAYYDKMMTIFTTH